VPVFHADDWSAYVMPLCWIPHLKRPIHYFLVEAKVVCSLRIVDVDETVFRFDLSGALYVRSSFSTGISGHVYGNTGDSKQYRLEVAMKMRRPELSKPKVWEKFFDKLNWDGISFPTSVQDIDTFEKNNEKVNIHVWALDEDNENVHVVRKSPRKVVPGTKVLDLLMLNEGEYNHFTTILNIGKFRRTGKKCKKFPCLTCSKLLNSKKMLAEHTRLGCNIARDGGVETMPRKYSQIMFESKNNKKTNHHPYVVYADFESLLIKVPNDDPRHKKGHRKIHDVSAYDLRQLIWSKKDGFDEDPKRGSERRGLHARIHDRSQGDFFRGLSAFLQERKGRHYARGRNLLHQGKQLLHMQ